MTDLGTTSDLEEITAAELRRRQQIHPDLDGEREFRCPRCQAACTQSPSQPSIEYGHRSKCPRRPDHFPYGEPSLLPISPEVATDGGDER